MLTATTALCGHAATPTTAGCDPYERRNTVVDHVGDVVLYIGCDGVRYLFRDGVDDGLRMTAGPVPGTWALTLARHTEIEPGRWDMVLAGQPLCTGGYAARNGRRYVARRGPTSRAFLAADTSYGLLGKVARWYLSLPGEADDGCE